MTKLATWNLCLGLKKKKDYVLDILRREKIDICCLQEIEIASDFPVVALSSQDYIFESETNDVKSRTGVYIRSNINYERRRDLEGSNNGIIIIDFHSHKQYRLVNLYRVFNPQNGRTQIENFQAQLDIIQNAMSNDSNKNVLITGDFNLDDSKRYSLNYHNHNLFSKLHEKFDPLGLVQLVNFPTWERRVDNVIKNSILDHLYVKDCMLISNISPVSTEIGDHLLVTFSLIGQPINPKTSLKRSWINYSKEALLAELSEVNFNLGEGSVQSLWNCFENLLIPIVDKLIPIVPFSQNCSVSSQKPPKFIKNKINLRNRLLKQFKITKDITLKTRLKNLNYEIRSHFEQNKRKRVRIGILPGNSKSLWTSVKIAKDLNIQKIPEKMKLNGADVDNADIPDKFASFFKDKITNYVNESRIDNNVYNGTRKVNEPDVNFMSEIYVKEAIMSIKTKNCEGYDRIPQRILTDGIDLLLKPLSSLFDKIYNTKELPEQWLISKIIPVFKKNTLSEISNYRPIANLCSTTKIFEKLILQRLHQIESQNFIDLTNKSQHGFKKNRSTNSASLILQSVLARSLDENNYALMASLDLSAAFDLVNVELLIIRLRRIGLPDDVISLVRNWLSLRYYYVSVDGASSIFHELRVGTVQGSILGPILYAMFVCPLFDLAKMSKFADDNFVIKCNKFLPALINDMKQTLEMIIKWLKDSGLKINELKTDLCLFHRADNQRIEININGSLITSNLTINVLGVIFDSKLQWGPQIENVIKKANKAKHAIQLIRKFFNKAELSTLLTSNFYSILYYNCDVWLIPSLKPQLKQHLLSASAKALTICTPNYNNMMSFEQIHVINKRATPNQMLLYKHSLLLHKIWNDPIYSKDWLDLNFQQNFNERRTKVMIFDTSQRKIGKNLSTNRLKIINGLIEHEWLNLSMNSFKIKCKILFLNT